MKTFYYTIDTEKDGDLYTVVMPCKENENLYYKIKLWSGKTNILAVTPHATLKSAKSRALYLNALYINSGIHMFTNENAPF